VYSMYQRWPSWAIISLFGRCENDLMSVYLTNLSQLNFVLSAYRRLLVAFASTKAMMQAASSSWTRRIIR
jgi:hypothetical protein